ncbi:MAG: phosphohydrolase [Bacilli bacterium]|jgi:uncharacterized protein|nr:phosphohydrolase [Bacilli bacterium]
MLNEKEQSLVTEINNYLLREVPNHASGHDLEHANRVLGSALHLASFYPKAQIKIIIASSLLHDVEDRKIISSLKENHQTVIDFISSLAVFTQTDCKLIEAIIANLSYTAYKQGAKEETIEGQIVQDADRLEAIGAIGIARAFSYGALQNRPLFINRGSEEATLKHFTDKLFKLLPLFNTEEGKKEAQRRHLLLQEFYNEALLENEFSLVDNK